MPVVIERYQRSTIRTAKQQAPAAKSRLIYSCIVVIVVCWCLVALQVFGGPGRTAVGQKPANMPSGIKLILPPKEP
jgi:hypothetical protein